MILGGITGWAAPKLAGALAPFGKVFINMMFCIVVPLVFASISFFAIFAGLVADFGSMITESYGRAMVIYYLVCVIFFFTAFPLLARIGGGKGAAKVMFRHITSPVVVSLGTCSSSARSFSRLRQNLPSRFWLRSGIWSIQLQQ